jgi:hypothetical protein
MGKIRNVVYCKGQKMEKVIEGKGKGYPCTGTEALYRPYGS